MKKKKVIVIGAGIAGLAAGRALAEADASVTVLESRNRIGGRIHTLHVHDQTLELGAEFVHGLPAELWRIIREANLRTEELQGKHICYEQGELTDCGSDWDKDLDLIEALKEWKGNDCSFAEYLNHRKVYGERRERLVSYVEGFNAADHRIIGVTSLGKQQAAEDAIESDRLFRLCDGYSQIPDYMAKRLGFAGAKLLLNTHVQSVVWEKGRVEMICTTNDRTERFLADCAVITLPLGVLQRRTVKFLPEPAGILQAAALARMGHVQRVELVFKERFWSKQEKATETFSVDEMSFLYAIQEIPPTWWTQFPSRNGCLTAWTGGPRAEVLAGMDTIQLAERICSTLSRMFRLPAQEIRALLIACHSHEWEKDPLSQGAYSYLPAGAMDAPDQMSEPVSDTLYFAGEHTDTTGHLGTVHAALRSGQRAATQILGA